MQFLVLRLDAPLISFGTTAVDHRRVTARMPALSMLAGMLANALGHRHSESERTQRLQERILFASRQDRAGVELRDFQTVDLGNLSSFPAGPFGWTTRGSPEKRAGSVSASTHIRLRDYLADSVHTVVLALEPESEYPTLDHLARALRHPSRPLFIGRKCCPPARPLLEGRIDAEGPFEAIRRVPRDPRADEGPLPAWWPDRRSAGRPGPVHSEGSRLVPTFDQRDWANQVHTGRRMLRHGTVMPEEQRNGV